MDKPVHIQILEVLQTRNAIGVMVDIKPMFEQELNTQPKRKNFKSELEYLVSEKLVEAEGRFEFLSWEVIGGLYPLDNKKIEAKLIGKWEAYLTTKNLLAAPDAVSKLAPLPEAGTMQKLSTYNAPSEGRPFTAAQLSSDKPVMADELTSVPVFAIKTTPVKAEIEPEVHESFLPDLITPEPVIEEKPAEVPRIHPLVAPKQQLIDANTPIITARTAGQKPEIAPVAYDGPPRFQPKEPATPLPTGLPPERLAVRPWQKQEGDKKGKAKVLPSSIHFDTENNPFAGLEVIDLTNDEVEAKKKAGTPWLMWVVIAAAFILLAMLIAVYKHRQGA